MKKFKILLGFLIFFLVACSNDTSNASLTGDPIDTNKVQVYYDPIDKKLVKFNPNGNTSHIINPGESQFAYDIDNADNVFVTGDSKNYKYKLIRINGEEIETIYEFKAGEEIFPIGYNSGDIYFIHNFYNKNGEEKEKRTLSLINLETLEITDIDSVKGLLADGVVSPNNIYYTVYNSENNYYELYRKSIKEGKKSEAAELISVGYQTPDLYLSKDLYNEKEIMSLYASDEDRIYSKEKSWDKFGANYFKPSTVIGIDKNADKTMNISFIEKRNKEKVNEVDDVVGIRFENDSIVVATKSGASKY